MLRPTSVVFILRLLGIAGALLAFLVVAADAQREPQRERREFRDPRDQGEFRDRRDQDLRDQRDQRDRGDRGDRRDRIRSRGNDYVFLGQLRVGLNVDRDTLRVGQPEAWFQQRFFSALHFFVEENDVLLLTINIKYLNGYVDPPINVGRVIERGGRYAVDFPTPRSYISEIEMLYQSNNENARGQALIKVYGEVVRSSSIQRPGQDEWVELGCIDVKIFGDADVINVGRREGRFKAIRLHVRHADVQVDELKVVYAAGGEDDIFDRLRYVEAGEYTRALDLRGNQRSIARIEILSRSAIRPVDIVLGEEVRRPKLCVEGLQFLPEELLRGPNSGAAPGAGAAPAPQSR
jgi:hypothetical protein